MQLDKRRRDQVPLSDADALAAIQLIAYFMLTGGTGDWHSLLQLACEWLEQTGLPQNQNPGAALAASSETTRYACRAVVVSRSFPPGIFF